MRIIGRRTRSVAVFLLAWLLFLPAWSQSDAEQGALAGEDYATKYVSPNAWWAYVGCLIGPIAPILAYSINEFEPNPTTLVGKSPAYIAAYSKAFKAKAREKNAKKAMLGCALTYLPAAIIFFMRCIYGEHWFM